MTNPNTDQGREDLIVYCGKSMEDAVANGDMAMARFWLEAMEAQIAKRTPAQVARMEAERGLV